MALLNKSACKRIKIKEENIVHRWHRQEKHQPEHRLLYLDGLEFRVGPFL